MVKEESIKKNYLYNTISQLIVLIVPFITTPYIARVLGAENIGKYSFATAIVTYFAIFAVLGSTTYGQRTIAYYRDDKKKLSQAFWNIFSFRVIASVTAMICYYIYLGLSDNMNALTVATSFNIINVIADVSWFFQGIEKFKQIVLRNVIVKLISLICVFTLIKNADQTWLYAFIITFSLIIGNLTMWRVLPKYVGRVGKICPFSGFREMYTIFLPTIATQVYTILDKTMIGWITNSNYANGCYEQSEKIARIALTVVTSIGAVILPRVSNLHHKGEDEKAKRYVYSSYRMVWMISMPMIAGLIAVSDIFILIYLGKGYDDSILLLKIFSLLILFVSESYVTGLAYLIPTGQQKIYTIAVSIAAGVNLIMNIFLIKIIGACGAAISSVVAEGVGASIQLLFCIRKKQLKTSLIFEGWWKYFVSAAVMFCVVVFVKNIMNMSLLTLLILIILGCVSYVCMLLVMRDDFFILNMKKVVKSVKKIL